MATQPSIERASSSDLAFMAMDTGPVPQQFGVLLKLDGFLDLAQARRLLEDRVAAVPRLRQRLVRPPLGGGGPAWVDDPRYRIEDHVVALSPPRPLAPAPDEVLARTRTSAGHRRPAARPDLALDPAADAARGPGPTRAPRPGPEPAFGPTADPGPDAETDVKLAGAEPADADLAEADLVDAALHFVLEPLPRDRPLWRIGVLAAAADDTDDTGDTAASDDTANTRGRMPTALVVVLHHTLADGLAGLAVLAGLVDEGADTSRSPFPSQPPRYRALALDAAARRARSLSRLPGSLRLMRTSMAGAGGLHPPRAVDCSLVQRTGPARRAVVARVPLRPVRDAAHALGATTNDVLLVAVARTLGTVLAQRGEAVPELVVTAPVAGRRDADTAELGNLVSPIIVAVPTTGPFDDALARVSTAVRRQRSQATGPPPIAFLGSAFRLLARAGGYRWYLEHQHRFHTLVSHLRGPAAPLHIGGRTITDAVPLAVAEGGNVTVYFEALSYAGTLTVTAMVDPEHFPRPDRLAALLTGELARDADLRPARP